MGERPFDLLIAGGLVADVITGRTRRADVGLTGPLIASVHPPGSRSDAHAVKKVPDGIIAPGLIDAHMHIESSMVTPVTYAASVLAKGVTTLVWDPHEFGNVWGSDGVAWATRQASQAPLRILVLAPSCVPSAPGLETAGADLDDQALSEILSRPSIGGLAEVMDIQGVINREPRMSKIVQAGLSSGKPVFGHARGLFGQELNAYAAAGVSSDHELTSAADLRSKLEAGLFIELRGSHDHLLPEFVRVLAEYDQLPPTLTLCTDDVFPDDLEERGGLDDVVRRLVRYGMPPLNALRAATFNAAQRLGRNDLGAVSPGRRADLVVFEDLSEFRPIRVIFNGRPISASGPEQELQPMPASGESKSMPFKPDDFRVRSEYSRVRVATIDKPRFTQWGETTADVVGGRVVPPFGSTLMSVVNRHVADASPRVAFLRGWGDWNGAFCTTVSHDSHNLTVFGSDPSDMATAANAAISAGGGLAVVREGDVKAVLPLPIAGLVSDRPLGEVSAAFRAVKSAMEDVVDWQPPYLVFKACFGASLACNPGPHLTDMGIADAIQRSVLPTPVLGPCAGDDPHQGVCGGEEPGPS